MKKITVILKIKTSLSELVTECLELFGEGARPDYEQEEAAFAYNNTQTMGGYIRIYAAEHIAVALNWMLDSGIKSANAEIIKVEWLGQDMELQGEELVQVPLQVDTGTTEDGVTYPIYLGRLS